MPRIFSKLIVKVLQDYESTDIGALDINMGEYLYGLTFFFMIYILQIVEKNWDEEKYKGFNKQNVLNLINHSAMLKNNYKKRTKMEFFINFLLNYWFKKNRVQQFKYSEKKKNEFKAFLFFILFIILIIVLINTIYYKT